MKNITPQQRQKLIAVQILAEKRNNFDILDVINNLVYVDSAESIAFTDGKLIYVGPRWFSDFDTEEMYFILNHEFDHIYYRHFNRFNISNEQERMLVNVATDIIINEILASEGLKQPEGTLTRKNVTESVQQSVDSSIKVVLNGKNSNAVHKELIEYLKDAEKNPFEQDGSNQSMQGEPSDGEPEEDQSVQGEPSDDKKAGKTPSEIILGDQADEYVRELEKYERDLQKAKDLPIEDKEEKEEVIRDRVIAKQAEASVRRTNEATRLRPAKVKIDWTRILMQFLGRHLKVKEERNIRRPSSRYRDILPGVIMPSNTGRVRAPKINVYLDVSGSMSHIIQNVRNILGDAERYFKQYPGKYYEFDTEIYEFKSRKEFIENQGTRGGTDITKVLNHYKQDSSSDLGILITDAGDQFSEALNNIDKPTLIITDATNLSTPNKRVVIVETDFR